MKFSKEEIETAKKVFETYKINPGCSNSYNEFLSSLFKPETKFINVRIEYVPFKNAFDSIQNLYTNDVKRALCSDLNSKFNIKVTELPEVFTREEVIKFAENYAVYGETSVKDYFNIYFSERKSK